MSESSSTSHEQENNMKRKKKIENDLCRMNELLMHMTKKQINHSAISEEVLNKNIFDFIRKITSIRERMLANIHEEMDVDMALKNEIAQMEMQASLLLETLEEKTTTSSGVLPQRPKSSS
jgi:hypothetical protein